ncbi:hypothetical protein ALC62_11073 [Cyphomyrmex costatus]|uniref:Uncharacterized protein n=1 Tax=Cyphomyrmex costatus TaxID=456900 RepID=A0A151ICT4_9HYME|nr:hypothetical protein ALC62_11073 [Cyphomyrmex costatus]
MTCFLPSKRATPVLVPATVHYSRNFHTPIFKRVTVVNTVSVVFLPPPLKITSKSSEKMLNQPPQLVVVVVVDVVDGARTRSRTQENNLRKNNDTHDFGDGTGNGSPEFVTTRELTRRRVVSLSRTSQARTGSVWSSGRLNANESERLIGWIVRRKR